MVMTAFNAIDRKPISGNKELLKGLLRDKEGFEGTVISDWGSIGQLEEQGVAADMEEAAIQASEAGVDIDMMSPAYMLCLEKLVESGKIPEAFVDESAFRVLMMKNQQKAAEYCLILMAPLSELLHQIWGQTQVCCLRMEFRRSRARLN